MKEEALIEMKTVEQELIAFDNQLYHYRGIVAMLQTLLKPLYALK